ncbi:hypothetical protein POV26_07375 [Aequorivita todarodis]|uniref:hypothetical protein n=1 Tax=Aequorivita todarodis TaxID=2036821 RepID=UPI00234FDB06|nr:hypothetical protein [Aequorivita todarodis]MDC8000852.1 hypothetical protein [Aequorivita todarodis]
MDSIKEILGNLDDKFETVRYLKDYENSIKEISNWFIAISSGIFTILIFKLSDENLTGLVFMKILFKVLVILSLLIVGFYGLCKFLILRRDYQMNFLYSLMKKEHMLCEIELERIMKSNVSNGAKKLDGSSETQLKEAINNYEEKWSMLNKLCQIKKRMFKLFKFDIL